MLQGYRIGAVLLIGGKGLRFGSSIPKQFHRLGGKPIYLHCLQPFFSSEYVDEIILSCPPQWHAVVQKTPLPSHVRLVNAGNTRQESSFNGLKGFFSPPDIVAIHDGVRPFLSKELLRKSIEGAIRYGAVNPCISSSDTIVHAPKESIFHIPPRVHYLRGQTPQSFSYSKILQAHQKTSIHNATDDCQLLLEQGQSVRVIPGDEQNIKITSETDLFVAEHLLSKPEAIPSLKRSRLDGKMIAIVGGNGGIGTAIAQSLKQIGAHVIPLSRTSSSIQLDLESPTSILAAFEKVAKIHGSLDGLINCSGKLIVSPLHNLTPLEIDSLLSVNLKGVILSCLHAQLKKGAHLINIASSSFSYGRKNCAPYSAAKAGIVNFTQALAEERPELYIHAVIPHRTRSPMRLANFPGENLEDLLDPQEIAETVLDLLQNRTQTGLLVEVRKRSS